MVELKQQTSEVSLEFSLTISLNSDEVGETNQINTLGLRNGGKTKTKSTERIGEIVFSQRSYLECGTVC